MIDSKTVRGGEARGEHASMRLLLQGFPAREMRFGGGTGGRMSCCTSTTVHTAAAIEMWPARRRSPMQSLRHSHSAITVHTAAVWRQLFKPSSSVRWPAEGRRKTVVQPQATGPLSG
jgi:hypothetical protein